MQPDCVNLWYFKLRLIDPTKYRKVNFIELQKYRDYKSELVAKTLYFYNKRIKLLDQVDNYINDA